MSGSFKRKGKKAQIKILGTPPLLNFKILGGELPQTQDLIDACWLYFIAAPDAPLAIVLAVNLSYMGSWVNVRARVGFVRS